MTYRDGWAAGLLTGICAVLSLLLLYHATQSPEPWPRVLSSALLAWIALSGIRELQKKKPY